MDISLILTIVFGVAGLYGVFLGWKAIFKPKIQMVSEDVTIIANIGKISNDLKVKYKEQEVDKDLRLISAYLINVGNVDISVEDVEQAVTINLPSNSKWLSFQVEKNNHNMIIDGEFLDGKLVIATGLWKRNEGFKFDALVTTSNSDILEDKNKIFKLIRINSRIKGLGEIDVTPYPEEIIYKNSFTKYLKLFLPLLLAMTYVILGVVIYMGLLTKEKFSLELYDDKYEILQTQKKDNNWVLRSLNTEYPRDEKGFYDVKVKLFNSSQNTEGDEKAGLVSILMGLILIVTYYLKHIKNYLLKKKVLKS